MAERRKVGRGWLVAGAAALLVVLAAVTPSPFVVERPGPVVNALGSIETDEGEIEVVRISGTDTFETAGSLNVLSVSISGTPEQPSSWLSLIGPLLDPTRSILPVSELFPPGMSSEDRRLQNETLMRGSQTAATAAALNELGEEVEGTVRIVHVQEGGPADGVMQEGDAILLADGQEISTVAELRAVLAEHGTGPVTFGIERDGETLEVSGTPVEGEDGNPVMQVAATTEFEFPFEVDLELDQIGGPSAGLIFALAVYDALTPGAMTGGLDVSGTGTIDDSGAVGAIGGLEQKIWGASLAGSDLLLMPVDNCPDLPDSLPRAMMIAPVATLDEAIEAIEIAAQGGTPSGLERCETVAAAG